jgi:hypothetical protein
MSSHAWYEFFVKFSIKYTHKKAEVIISALVLFDKLIGTINILKIKEYIFSNYLYVYKLFLNYVLLFLRLLLGQFLLLYHKSITLLEIFKK